MMRSTERTMATGWPLRTHVNPDHTPLLHSSRQGYVAHNIVGHVLGHHSMALGIGVTIDLWRAPTKIRQAPDTMVPYP